MSVYLRQMEWLWQSTESVGKVAMPGTTKTVDVWTAGREGRGEGH